MRVLCNNVQSSAARCHLIVCLDDHTYHLKTRLFFLGSIVVERVYDCTYVQTQSGPSHWAAQEWAELITVSGQHILVM